jgi:hypothetical protein
MGTAVLDAVPEICEIRLQAPNKHHFVVDLTPFSLENPNEVFYAADRPYGLIEATIARDDAPPAGDAWKFSAGLAWRAPAASRPTPTTPSSRVPSNWPRRTSARAAARSGRSSSPRTA